MRELPEGIPGRIKPHTLVLENRERVVITGVDDVDNFNEEEVNLMSAAGYISLKGKDLRISKLSLDDGQLIVEGEINGIEYTDQAREEGGFFGRLFR
jgi:sporulation protein YabP